MVAVGIICLVGTAILLVLGIGVHAQRVVVPQGISAVNGSSTDMGCIGVEQNGSHTICDCSYLTDGVSPDIDTCSSDWASQLVTVRRDPGNPIIAYPHVLLTFVFDTPVSPTGIDIDLFNCPDWNIGAPDVTAYFDPQYEPSFDFNRVSSFSSSYLLPQPSCDSLSTVTFSSIPSGNYQTIHILVKLQNSPIQWIHVGEVRFIPINIPECPQPTTSILPTTCTSPSSSSSAVSTSIKALHTSSAVTIEQQQTSVVELTSLKSSTSIPDYSTQLNTSLYPIMPPFIFSFTTEPLNSVTQILMPTTTSSESIPTPPKTPSVVSTPTQVLMLTSTSSKSTLTPLTDLTPSITLSVTKNAALDTPMINSSTPSTESNDEIERPSSLLAVLLTIALLMFLSIVVILALLIGILCRYRVKERQKLGDLRKNQDNTTHNDNNMNLSAPTVELSNPTYARTTTMTESQPPPAAAGGYSQINIDKIYSTARGSETKTVPPDGEVFIGMYDVACRPTNPAKNKAEMVNSAAYASINVIQDPPYAAPDELDRKKVQKSSSSQLQQIKVEGLEAGYAAVGSCEVEVEDVRSRMYSDVQVREVPSIPTKSSDLLEELDVEAELNVGVYSESINPLDFTRNRKEGQGNEPQILGPIFPVLPESYTDNEFEVSNKNIAEMKQMGVGQFGEVVVAKTSGLSLKTMGLSKTDTDKSVSVKVVVKKLRFNSSPAEKEVFDKEAELMSRTRHPNVLRLLGVCYHDPAFIMMEFPDKGDLHQFLKQYSEIVTTSSSQVQITTSELIYIASQIASGMQYLASFQFVHRDLAVRTCFVGANNSIKVGDLGVTKSLYQSSYYHIRGNRMMPIRWMATECFDGKFSEKSDVWAFGVTMCELFTLAKDLPYPHLSDEEVVHNALKREYRQFPTRPSACPLSVYGVMEQCWEVDMRLRPTFKKLLQFLEKE